MVNETEIELLTAHRTFCPPEWLWDNEPGDTDVLDLWFVTEGRGTMDVRGTTYELAPGCCFALRMWEECHGRHDPGHPLTVLWTFYRYKDGRRSDDSLPVVFRRIPDVDFFASLYGRAIDRFAAGPSDRAMANRWMQAALLYVEDTDASPRPRDDDRRRALIGAICSRIRANPAADYPLNALARECSCSAGHFTRLFTRCTGKTPREFIVSARIAAAQSLLKGSSQKISLIAEDLGYGDVYHFSRQFKEKTGVPPSVYRRDPLQ